MTSRVARALLALAALAFTLPLAFIATFALAPLWRWVEASLHIESIGHSGPATWCFAVVEALFVIALIALAGLRRRS